MISKNWYFYVIYRPPKNRSEHWTQDFYLFLHKEKVRYFTRKRIEILYKNRSDMSTDKQNSLYRRKIFIQFRKFVCETITIFQTCGDQKFGIYNRLLQKPFWIWYSVEYGYLDLAYFLVDKDCIFREKIHSKIHSLCFLKVDWWTPKTHGYIYKWLKIGTYMEFIITEVSHLFADNMSQ